ncbi:MAG: ATP-binding protein [bacterium]|nr:ATP-binding protein [bacterium]
MRRKFKVYAAFLLFVLVAAGSSILMNSAAIVESHSDLEKERHTNNLYHHLLIATQKSQSELYKFEAGFSLDLDGLVETVEDAEARLKSVSDIEAKGTLGASIKALLLNFDEYKKMVSMVVTESSPERKDLSAREASAFGLKLENTLAEMDIAIESRMSALNQKIEGKIRAARIMVAATVVIIIISILMILLHVRSTIVAPLNSFILFLKDVAESGNLSYRSEIPKDRDLATLAENFNGMLANIERQDLELKSSLEELEVSNEELQNSYINMEDLTSELESKSQDLAEANEELKGMDRMKNEFMQNVSHELRTPLTPIVGYLELFINKDLGPLNSMQAEIIGDMYQCGKRLGFAIDSLLEMVSLQEEQVTEKFEPIDVKSLFVEVKKIALEDIEDKKLSCKIDCQEDLRPIMGARKKMVLMLNHILKNAVKFTPEGGEVSFHVSSGDEGDIKFVISDNGVGICEDKLKSIFEPFLQLDSSTTRSFEGVGLGLALVKRVVDMHRGSISIQSREDEGTTATVHIPLA